VGRGEKERKRKEGVQCRSGGWSESKQSLRSKRTKKTRRKRKATIEQL
jgi:hypothetical protein